MTGNKVQSIEFKISLVTRLGSHPTALCNTLYELRRQYPIIDCVGYLPDLHGMYWLVFIQVSLQSYEGHKNLCNMFRKAPPKSHVPEELKHQ